MKKIGTVILILLGIFLLAWIALNWRIIFKGVDKTKEKAIMTTDVNQSIEAVTTPSSNQMARILNQVRKSSDGTSLNLVGINSVTGAVVSTKSLNFDEAIKLFKTAYQVCGMAKYKECTLIRNA